MKPTALMPEVEVALHVPPDLLAADGSIAWDAVYARVGVATVADLKDALLALVTLDLDVALAVHRAVLALATSSGRDPSTHLPVLQGPPATEGEWLRADLGCESCAGSEMRAATNEDEVFDPAGLCGAGPRDRLVKWSNCIQYREAALGSAETREFAGPDPTHPERPSAMKGVLP